MKERIDTLIAQKGLARSRSSAVDLIKRGKVTVNGTPVKKPSETFDLEVSIEILEKDTYVSRGGIKLEHALKTFNIDVTNKVCVDIGSSTGGFTDCLLRHHAQKVYAVDVGTNQFDINLKSDPRVTLFEQTDIRNAKLPEKINLAVIDVSFISLTLILQEAIRLMDEKGDIIALIKPQFEVGAEHIGKGGIVKNDEEQKKALLKIIETGKGFGLTFINTTVSPILGGDGNKEYFVHFTKN